jgi:hypothetical protein
LDSDAVIETLYGNGVPRGVYEFVRSKVTVVQRAESGIDDLDAVAKQFLPATLVVYEESASGDPQTVGDLHERDETYPARERGPYLSLRDHIGNLESAAKALDRYLAKPEFLLKRLQGPVVTVKNDDPVHVELKAISAKFRAAANNRVMLDALRAASTKTAKFYIGMLSEKGK